LSDHYKTLQVTRDAEPEVIERAFKALTRKYHPDRASDSDRTSANRRMQRLNEAYEVLRDPERRRAYDAELPPEAASAWDVFLERGLVGMFLDRFGSSRR
jgi:DnaJ-class molecular chaperone